ncbi:hypothetical protein D3C87_1727000 [compost metagenome]
MAFGRVGVVVAGRIGIPVHVPAEGAGELAIAPVEGFHAETEGELPGAWPRQGRHARDNVGNQWLVDKQVHRGQFQALVRVAGQRQVAQAVVALIAGRTVVAHVTDVEQP